ncbi:MAG: hypothetical protein HY319_30160 [Armatimonadetes bacterium]|nr:hypothetical protein [Armatimonadota bacterium]
MNPQRWERHATDLGLARYAVIAPLVTRSLSQGEYRLEFHGSSQPSTSFRTVSGWCPSGRRWCDWYRNGHLNEAGERDSVPGVDGLKPSRRIDLGQARVLKPATAEQAVRLRAEEPAAARPPSST